MPFTALRAGPQYHIQVFRTGECRVMGRYSYLDFGTDKDHLFTLYLSVIRGDGVLAVVDTGMESVAAMNRDAGFLMSQRITQAPGEDTPGILKRAGIKGQDVDYIFLTHCHYDHCSNLALFPNARVVIPAYAWDAWYKTPEKAIYLHAGFLAELETLQAEGRLLLQDSGVVMPGIGVQWVGGHSICSQFVAVHTHSGIVLFTGDTVQMYANLEHDAVIGIYDSVDQCKRAMQLAREVGDVIIPGHDPLVLELYTDGVVA